MRIYSKIQKRSFKIVNVFVAIAMVFNMSAIILPANAYSVETVELCHSNEGGGYEKVFVDSDYVDSSEYDHSDHADDFLLVGEYCQPYDEPTQGNLQINEVMINPDSVEDIKGEWFEVKNLSDSFISLNNCELHDDGSDNHLMKVNFLIGPGEYVVMGKNDDISQNGGVPVDYVYSGFSLSNTEDEIVIECNDIEIDRVNYNSNFPLEIGKSMILKVINSDNSLSENWCVSSSVYGDGDLGTPGAFNDSCYVCGNGKLEGDEECDGDELDDYTCSDFDFDAGNLTCDSSCNIQKDECTVEEDVITVKAWKVVCDSEELLPNWGEGDLPGGLVTANTASDFVSQISGCHLEPNWNFQWGHEIWEGNGNFYGPLEGWNSFDTSTTETEPSMVKINNKLVDGKLWFREVLQEGYIPYAFPPAPATGNLVSAEIYCHDDILNYDNMEWIQPTADLDEYYCIAFNVLKDTPQALGSITIIKEAGDTGEVFGFNGDWQFSLSSGNSQTFEDLENGVYSVFEENLATDWYLGDIDCGEASTTATEMGVKIEILDGDNVTCAFTNGYQPPISMGSIAGCKYEDSDNNADITGENRLPGWEIELWSYPWAPKTNDLFKVAFVNELEPGAPSLLSATTTDEFGCYSFDNLGSGWYSVNEVMQEGWTQTYVTSSSTFWFNPGIESVAYDFGNYREPYCGDSVCSESENCEICSADCGSCGGECTASYTYTIDDDFDEGILSGVEHTSVNNQLQLVEGSVTTYPVMWIANAGDDTVSKWNTNTNKELARYATWFGAPNDHGAWSGAAPSRTAVDTDGNCYIANRHFDGLPADVLKILSDDWIDRNGNGVIDTSVDLNNDGTIDPSEMLPLIDTNGNGVIDDGEIQDERIAWVKSVGSNGAYGRSLAIDLNGNIWLGLFNTREYYKLSGVDGTVLDGPISVGQNSPYGALVDKHGILWGSSLSSNLLRLDTNSNTFDIYTHSYSNYGIALGYDSEDNTQVYLGYGNPYSQFNSKTNTFSNPIVGANFYSLGLAVDSKGNILAGKASSANTGGVTKYTKDGVEIWTAAPQVNSEARGVVVDSNDDVWVIHVSTNQMTKFSGVDGSPLGIFDSGLHPYTYSDATGLGLRGSITAGSWNVVNDSLTDNMLWQGISWNSLIPQGATMTVKVRTSNDSSTWSAWEIVDSGSNLSTVPSGRYLEVQVLMQTVAGANSPILYDLTLNRDCGEIISVCGNGIVDEGEQCDDSNQTSGDGCSATCANEGGSGQYCGDGARNGSEQCDGNDSVPVGMTCTSNCVLSGGGGGRVFNYCGDRIWQSPNTAGKGGPSDDGYEECDGVHNVPDGFVCNASCELKPVVVLGAIGPDLAIVKTIDRDLANPGDKNIKYTITVENIDPVTAENVVVEDILPAGLVYSDTGLNARSWNVGTIPPFEKRTIDILVDVNEDAEAGVYSSVSKVSATNVVSKEASVGLKIETVKVLGAELIPTGFSLIELLSIAFMTMSLFGLSSILRRKIYLS